MKIECTLRAEEKLRELLDPQQTGLKLLYDIEGCGCAVNGIARLVRVDRVEAEEGEALASNEPFHVFFETRQEVFFEDRMVLDFSQESGSYALKSDNQFYNPSFLI